MTNPARLLELADTILDGTVGLGVRGPRTAAVLTRSAFEMWLDAVSAPWAPAVGHGPSTRSKLVVLRALHGAAKGDPAEQVWHRLSRACHHHASDLQPSSGEIRRLVTLTRGLLAP